MIIFDDYVGEERKRRGCRKNKTYIRSKGQKKNENDGILPGSVGHSNVIVRTDFLKTRPETTRERKHHDFYMVSDIINSGGKYKRADVKYIRITNLDDSAVLKVGVIGDSSGAWESVAANTSKIFTGTQIEIGATFSSFANAGSIVVIGAAQQQLEVFVATT